VRNFFAIVSYAVVLYAARAWTDSTGAFLVIGCGAALLLDRCVFRLFTWPTFSWRAEIATRAACFLAGSVCFYCMRPGIVPIWEAAERGLVVMLLVLLGEQTALCVQRRWHDARLTGAVAVSLVAAFLLMIPVIGALHPLHTVPKRTPAAFGLDFEEVSFQAGDGVRLVGWWIPHASARGSVIFCHGHGRNRGHVAGLLKTLHELRLNVLAFDFRGHGDSAGHTSTFGQREVNDLIAAHAYLRERCTDGPVVLAGISLGAPVSLQALPALPDIRGVWSEGAFARFDQTVLANLRYLPAPLRPSLLRLYFALGWLECEFWGDRIRPIDRIGKEHVPIFFCHAQGDELVPFGEGQALFTSYAGPKWHWWVPGTTHYNIRQHHRDEYLRRLREFMEMCLARGESRL
jgi:fermentation-respiration switch protein FrsA (DUF1100 family)